MEDSATVYIRISSRQDWYTSEVKQTTLAHRAYITHFPFSEKLNFKGLHRCCGMRQRVNMVSKITTGVSREWFEVCDLTSFLLWGEDQPPGSQ